MLLVCPCLVRSDTNAVLRPLFGTKYWMPSIQGKTSLDESVLFENDFLSELDEFNAIKDKYRPLVRRWACIYLKRMNELAPKTLYVGPFTENLDRVMIYDYEGKSFWHVGNIKSIQAPEMLNPVLVTRIYTFDWLLESTFDANAKASQLFLIKWQVANCVMDGMRIDISSEEIANAGLQTNAPSREVKQNNGKSE